ncbi:PLP-dependent aminotransferase family protein [Erwinia sp. 9145]|uniref:MocR-like pyridoxine biosynthesis transcription factor PdxR n=1 Tax=Erwinia sp. 9145 TaxID=1500895 RepID=UPI00054EE5D8|nr:PLP-dependent aminotransferase family protein [Erwinia sp. 9145]
MPLTSLPLISLFASQKGQTKAEKMCGMLRQLIIRGALRQGERLPSSRLLASDLSLSRVTVEAAYGQLESEGYLRREIGRGTFVAVVLPDGALKKKSACALSPLISARGRQIIATDGCREPPFPQAFAAGSPDLNAFPHVIWRRLMNQRLRNTPSALHSYGDPQGHSELREAVARYLALSRGVRCEAEQVMILTSSQQALHMLALLLCNDGDAVWMEEPGYRGARNAFLVANAQLEALPVDNEGARLPAAPTARLAYLTPSHQYPLGMTMTLARRLQWLEFARRHSCWLIEDDYDSEFYYHDRPLPALQGLDEHNRVLYLGTFSKVLFPSLRLAYLVVPPALIDPLCRLRSVMDGHSAQLMQVVTADFINNGHFQAHLRLMRRLYGSRRETLLNELNMKLGDKLLIVPHESGLQLTVTLPGNDEQQLTRRAGDSGLVLPRLSPLYHGEPQRHGWLLGFSALRSAEIVNAVETLARCFR